MKNYFLLAVILHLLVSFSPPALSQSAPQNRSGNKAIAIVLQITGNNAIPDQVQLYSKNIFKGKVKNLKTNTAQQFNETVHVKFLDQAGQLLYQDYQQNPLHQNLESSEPDGTLQHHNIVTGNSYLNYRFPVNDNVTSIKVICYFIVENVEKEFSTLNITL